MAEYLPNVAHRSTKKHHAQAHRHEEHELHLTGTDVALAGIEPAPLLAQRAPYTKGSATLGLWGSSTIPPTATPAAT